MKLMSMLVTVIIFSSITVPAMSQAPTKETVCEKVGYQVICRERIDPTSLPKFVGQSKWCNFSPANRLLKGLAICAYDKKSECAQRIFLQGDQCLLNPRFDSDPSEEGGTANNSSPLSVPTVKSNQQRNLDVSNADWIFLASSSESAYEGYYDRKRFQRSGQVVYLQIAQNFREIQKNAFRSVIYRIYVDCLHKEMKHLEAMITTESFGGGQVVLAVFPDAMNKSELGKISPIDESKNVQASLLKLCAQ